LSARTKLASTSLTITLTACLMSTGAVSAHASTADPTTSASPALTRASGPEQPLDPQAETRVAVVPIIMASIAVGSSYYGMGQIAGERCYRAGLRNAGYQNVKWQVRATAVSTLGVGASVFMTGFENKFYSMG